MARKGLWSRLNAGVSGFVESFAMEPSAAPRGSRSGRRSSLFSQDRRQINSVIAAAGPTLVARCRFLTREDPLAGSMKRIWTDYAVGDGWTPSVIHPNAEVVRTLHAAFKAWTDVCDYDGRTDFYGLQGDAGDEEYETGEVFVRHMDPLGDYQIQLIAAEQLPYSTIAAAGYSLPADHEIRLGIEFDSKGRRVAYHFFKDHPGDGTKIKNVVGGMLVRIPAEEIEHVFTRRQPGQIRGYPRLAGAIVPLFKRGEYVDALIERAAQSSKYIGTITRGVTDDDRKAPEDASAEGAREYTLETGILYELDRDEKVDWSTPPDPGSNFDDFMRRISGEACMAGGTPAAETTGDLKGVNFSSIRVGRQPFRRAVNRWGNKTLVFQMLRPVWRMWLRNALLTGKITLPRGASRQIEGYCNVNWIAPFWESPNPIDDAKADEVLVNAGFKARSRVIEERGENAEEVDDRIEADQKRADRKKLRIGAAAKAQPTPSGKKPQAPKEKEPDE